MQEETSQSVVPLASVRGSQEVSLARLPGGALLACFCSPASLPHCLVSLLRGFCLSTFPSSLLGFCSQYQSEELLFQGCSLKQSWSCAANLELGCFIITSRRELGRHSC